MAHPSAMSDAGAFDYDLRYKLARDLKMISEKRCNGVEDRKRLGRFCPVMAIRRPDEIFGKNRFFYQ